jgi:HK97 family phage portal protein
MKILGFEFGRSKALNAVSNRGGWWPLVNEPYSGAWQQNKELTTESVLRFSAVFACVSGISLDIAKLQPRLMTRNSEGILEESASSPYARVLKKPNRYQNRIKFIENWVLSKLLYGNTYALKERDSRGIVTGLQILAPANVTVLVADDGQVYYQLRRDNLTQNQDVTIPASEVIHDRGVCLYHPLVGVSPLYAATQSASVGLNIMDQSEGFFKNKSAPGGVLTAPARISEETAARLKAHWENNYTGDNSGKVAVLGDGLKFEQLTMTAVDAELINQLKLSVQDIARAFRYPLTKLQTGALPVSNNVQIEHGYYYADCLQPIIESMELCLDEGLELPDRYMVELDLEGLSRMDTTSIYSTISECIKGGFLAPNEGRKRLNLPSVKGGDSPFLQVQNYSTEDLSKLRSMEFEAMQSQKDSQDNQQNDTPDNNQDDTQEQTRAMIDRIRKGILNVD